MIKLIICFVLAVAGSLSCWSQASMLTSHSNRVLLVIAGFCVFFFFIFLCLRVMKRLDEKQVN